MSGERAAIFGARWDSQSDRTYAATTYARFDQHEKDDRGRWFDGVGWELYADCATTERWSVGILWNYQVPTDGPPGSYKLDFVTVGASYEIPGNWRFYLMYKIERSRKSDGTPLGLSTLGAAIFYNFSRGFSLF